jgi:benzoate-CoA ligase family protein
MTSHVAPPIDDALRAALAFPERFNLAEYFLDRRLAEGLGDDIAIVDDGGQVSYRQLQALANQVASALVAAGVRAEDRVLIGLYDSIEFAAAFFGVLKAGAVVAMVNPELPAADYAHYLEYTRARVFLCDAEVSNKAQAQLDGARWLERAIAWGPDRGTSRKLVAWDEAVLGAATQFDNVDTSRDDFAIWLFTSGSTGKPKAAVHLQHDFAFNTECYAKRVLGIRRGDVTLGVPKLFFGYATGSNLMFPCAVGGKVVLFRDRATPERIEALCRQHRVTVLTSVPTMINKMCAHEGEPTAMASVRATLSAGEALPEELYHRYTKKFGGEILDGIGSAELFHIYVTNRPGDVRPGSLGRVVPGYEAKIVRPDGEVAGPGEIGNLWVKGDSAALFYFQAHERSKEVFRNDWVVSGDLFRCDEAGYFYYAGRADDLLKVGGIFVSPVEVEGSLMRHPRVLEAAVIGYEDEERLVKAMAYVVVREGAPDGAHAAELAEELIRHCKRELAAYKAPRKIEFVAALPRSDRGKILRRELGK